MQHIVDLMTQQIVSLEPDASVSDAISLMKEKKIGSILVAKGNDVFGIFTERDLLTKIDLDNPANITSLKINQVMTKDLITVDFQEPFIKVIDLMRTHNIRHTPVVKDGRVIGLVSLRELLTHYEEYLEQLLNEKEAALDTTLKKKNETEERFQMVFNNSPVGITLTDRFEKIVAFNPFIATLLGMPENELLNKPVQDLYPAEEWEKIRSLNIRKLGIKHHLETAMLGKNNNLIDVDISISVLKDAQGNITGSIGIIRDIREQKQTAIELEQYRKRLEEFVDKRTEELSAANEELRQENIERIRIEQELQKAYEDLQKTQNQLIQAEKMQIAGDLATGVAHEVKNPLMIIQQGVAFLKKKIETTDDNIITALGHMESAINRADRIVHGLLDFASISNLKFEKVNIINILDSALELTKHPLTKHRISVSKDFKDNDISVEVDKNKIEQVFVNLILNAVNAQSNGGAITIRVYVKEFNEYAEGIAGYRKTDPFRIGDKGLVVEIEDAGPGIPPEIIDKIFDPFFTTRRAEGGTGLGLSVVKSIISMHSGVIKIENRQDAHGVKVFVALRLSQPIQPRL